MKTRTYSGREFDGARHVPGTETGAHGAGKDKPVVPTADEVAVAQNRYVTIMIH